MALWLIIGRMTCLSLVLHYSTVSNSGENTSSWNCVFPYGSTSNTNNWLDIEHNQACYKDPHSLFNGTGSKVTEEDVVGESEEKWREQPSKRPDKSSSRTGFYSLTKWSKRMQDWCRFDLPLDREVAKKRITCHHGSAFGFGIFQFVNKCSCLTLSQMYIQCVLLSLRRAHSGHCYAMFFHLE